MFVHRRALTIVIRICTIRKYFKKSYVVTVGLRGRKVLHTFRLQQLAENIHTTSTKNLFYKFYCSLALGCLCKKQELL